MSSFGTDDCLKARMIRVATGRLGMNSLAGMGECMKDNAGLLELGNIGV